MRKIEHLGIAVKDIAAATDMYTTLLGVSPYKREEVESEGVATTFFQCGESKIELLEATASVDNRVTVICSLFSIRSRSVNLSRRPSISARRLSGCFKA